MRVLVCGGRHLRDWPLVNQHLDGLMRSWRRPTVLIEGGCSSGADRFARRWAMRHADVEHLRFNAKWGLYGKAAGPIRNQQMLEEGKPDLVLAFPGGAGTASMVALARAQGVEVREIRARP